MVALVRLVAKRDDILGYTTYVFECLEEYMIKQTKYIMCTRYPNWNMRSLEIGEEGFLEYKEVTAGVDQWFDGNNMNYYKYDAIQFLNFIEKPEQKDYKYVM